jgi:hypothetical protein
LEKTLKQALAEALKRFQSRLEKRPSQKLPKEAWPEAEDKLHMQVEKIDSKGAVQAYTKIICKISYATNFDWIFKSSLKQCQTQRSLY